VRHPAVVVDVERNVRVPVVAHRRFRIGRAGDVGWFRGAGGSVVLEQRGDGSFVIEDAMPTGDERAVAIAEAFEVAGRTYRVDVVDELIVGAHEIGEHVLFNAIHVGPNAQTWRARTRDGALCEVMLGAGAPLVMKASFGVGLTAIANETRTQRAQMDAALARALVAPLLADAALRMGDVSVTWDGDVHGEARALVAGAEAREAVRTFHRLCGAALPARIARGDVVALADSVAASPGDVAVFVRALFRDAWALEAAVREQAGALTAVA
jgi:hypothetical protein